MRGSGAFPKWEWESGWPKSVTVSPCLVWAVPGSAPAPRLISKQRSGGLCTWGEHVGQVKRGRQSVTVLAGRGTGVPCAPQVPQVWPQAMPCPSS